VGEWVVATFNVNSVKSRLPVLERWLDRSPVDVLCLQETKTPDEGFPEAFFIDRGYRVLRSGMRAYNGVAILSRRPVESWSAGFALAEGEGPAVPLPGIPSERPEEERARLIRARIGGVEIVNAYVPQGKSVEHGDYAYKLRFLERLTRYLEALGAPDRPLLLLGDLNVAPTEADVTSPGTKEEHVCFHRDVRRTYGELISLGLVDLFRRYLPGEGEFTFFDYRVPRALERNIGWRIDHVLATEDLADRSVGLVVDRELRSWERPSDHVPLRARFAGFSPEGGNGR
jgi:exodeoxyribonuclease-3